ncbi:alpha/beta hydrolase fold domain-containing protein, partial [Prevotella sp.]|uniref:alpha/beta hydrolase fold domain-containing protein n=1 Tax=Prevotella sp. TaxID=59823 RepID=UPI002A80DC14
IWDTMADCNTGQQRIAAVLPKDGKLIHKTGSGFPSSDGRQDRNDVGIILLPDGSHLSIAIFLQKSKEEKEVAEIAEQCLMRIQADKFLRNMPPDLQHKQTLAILRAIDGDNKGLTAVRNARNALPKYSDHVETKMITPSMRLYEPKGSQDQRLPVLLYLHGGGWTFGSINSCGRFCDALAASDRIRVIALDYRLAPEHPYPEGLDDCVSAVNYIIDHAAELHIDANHITIGGDSSGGNLALATALSATCRGKIESLLLLYPVTKAFDDGSESWQQYSKGFGLDAEIMEAFNRAYTINADNRCSAISVGLCSDEELNMLPRTLLIAAERDILRDQGLNLAERMCGKIQRIEYKGAVHLFITVPGQKTAFDRAVKDAIGFICNK